MIEDRPDSRPPREFRSCPPRGLTGFEVCGVTRTARVRAYGRYRGISDLKRREPRHRPVNPCRSPIGRRDTSIPDRALLWALWEPVAAPSATRGGA